MTYKVQGYIIRKQDSREYDKFFTLYTRELGKIRVIAQGVKKISSKLSGNLELLHHVFCTIAKGKQIDRITTVDILTRHEPIKDDIKKLICALYCLDVADHLIQDNQQDLQIYELMGEMLDVIAEHSSKQAPCIADAFLIKFRMLCGYGLPKRSSGLESLFSEKNLFELAKHSNVEDGKKMHALAQSFVSEYAEKELKTQAFFDFISDKKET